MKTETRIITLLMGAFLTLGSCTKKTITPAEDPQPAEVGFTASSQAVWVKGGETQSASDFPHSSFGVWGIARQGSLVYNLWGNDALMDVNENREKDCYEPEEIAYWLGGYTYNFLALAPHTEGYGVSFSDDEDIITLKDSQNPDKLSFVYDMSTQYGQTTPKYDFDLLGASANTGSIAGGRTDSQTLTFYHLFSQVNIGVSFTTGLNGEAIDGRLKRIKLENICTEANCEVYHNETTNKVHADWICDYIAKMDGEYAVSETVTFTVKADQDDATVTLKAGDQTVTEDEGEASIVVSRGTVVEYTVEETVADGEEAKNVKGEMLVHRSLTQKVFLESGETRAELHPDWSINVIPQDATKMKLYLDFEIYDNGTSAVYDNFEIGLSFPSDANPQVFNHKYNWNISIGTGAAIKFQVVDITDWTTEDGGDISM